MTHIYDWSKLDAGWSYADLGGMPALCFTESIDSMYSYVVESLESNIIRSPAPDAKWKEYRPIAIAQLAKGFV